MDHIDIKFGLLTSVVTVAVDLDRSVRTKIDTGSFLSGHFLRVISSGHDIQVIADTRNMPDTRVMPIMSFSLLPLPWPYKIENPLKV